MINTNIDCAQLYIYTYISSLSLSLTFFFSLKLDSGLLPHVGSTLAANAYVRFTAAVSVHVAIQTYKYTS
jgi:hypothetical protein